MLKIFMTGDNHIGLKYSNHEKAEILAEARISALNGMIRAANDENCSLFVITGDLFENTYGIPEKTVKRVMDALSGFNGTVAVLPGNHDFYDKDSKLWRYINGIAAVKDNILILNEYRPYPLHFEGGDAVLYPALCTSLHSAPGNNNLGWIKELQFENDKTYRIGIAHGAVEGETIDSEGQYFLMRRAELESLPMTVWLIGHTHVPFPADLKTDSYTAGKIFNAGAHVQTDVSCNTEGCCFIIQISDDGSVSAKKFKSGNLRFVRRNVKLTAGNARSGLAVALADLDDACVVDLIIGGAVGEEEYENRHEIIESCLSRFIEGTYDDGALTEIISGDLIDKEFPETSFSAEFLKALLDEPKEAQLVYDMLKVLKEGR